MRRYFYAPLIFAALIFANCSSNPETANNSAQNSDDHLNSASADIVVEGSAVESNLGKISADAVINKLYAIHNAEKGPFFETTNRKSIDQFFDKSLADLIWKDFSTRGDEVGVLDFDALYNAQDFDIKKFSVGESKISGESAEVLVTFENFGKKETVRFAMVKRGDSWKISDIKYSTGDTLRGYFKSDATNTAARTDDGDGNFEGTYKVGDTTCVVKPIKMAFELKWAKGSGSMTFFFDSSAAGGLTYISEDNPNGTDKFVFDDETLSTGKFIRGDGKVLPVSRIKG